MDLFNTNNSNEKFINDTFSNVFQTFVTNTLERNNLITTGPNAGGNLSQAQIAQGQKPVVQNVVQPTNSSGFNSMSGGMLGMSSTMTWVLIGGAVVVVGFLLLKK